MKPSRQLKLLSALALGLFACTLVHSEKGVDTRLSAYQRAKSDRILQERLSCLGCHRYGTQGGSIAPDLLSVRYRHTPAEVARIIDDPQQTMPGSIMPRIRLQAEMRDAILALLFQQDLAPDNPQGSTVWPRAVIPHGSSGERLFKHYCAACHGVDGKGDGPNAQTLAPPPTNLSDATLLSRRSDDTLFDIIATGGRVFDLNPRMPPWGETLDRTQIRSLVAHIRTLCGCRGPGWSSDGAAQ